MKRILLEWGVAKTGLAFAGASLFLSQAMAGPIISSGSGKCVDVGANSTANGAVLIQYDCHGEPNQDFAASRRRDGFYTIKAAHSGRCLDVGAGSVTSGVQVVQKTCAENPAQQFALTRQTDGSFAIKSRRGNGCLNVAGNSTANGAAIETRECGAGAFQKFRIPDLTTAPLPKNAYRAQYFNSVDFSALAASRVEPSVDFTWGRSSPAPGVNADNFSVRFMGDIDFDKAGTYRFTLRGDDGVRLFVDGAQRINGWLDQGATDYVVDVPLTAGSHRIRVDYYERSGDAVVRLSYTLVSPPPTTTPSPTPTPAPPSGAIAAQTFSQGLTFGLNVERARAWYISDFGSGTAGYSYYKSLGITHVRLFYPFRPSLNMGGSAGADIAPTRAEFVRILESARNANRAGLKVMLDLLDVMGTEDFQGPRQALVDNYVRMAAEAIRDYNFDPRTFSVGPVNEWAGGGSGNVWASGHNPTYNGHRRRLIAILRQELPNHALISGPAYWKHYEQLMQSDFELAADANVIYDVHSYDWNAYDPAHYADVSQRLQAWRRAKGNPVVIWGESGFGWDNGGDPNSWVTPMNNFRDYMMPFAPTMWAITDGGQFRMNPSPNSHLLYPFLEDAIRYNLSR